MKKGNKKFDEAVVDKTLFEQKGMKEVFFPKDIQEGSIVYKCTKEMESSEKDSNYFVML